MAKSSSSNNSDVSDNGSSTTMTKTAAVMQALAAGMAKPAEGVTYIKEKFGIDVTRGLFSIIKSQHKKKSGRRKSSGGSVERENEGRSHRQETGSPLDLARKVKSLVDTYGVDAVKSMADVFES